MDTSYKTIKKAAEAEIVEKKSRFICHIRPVTTEKEALDFLNEIRAQYRDATHNVYAYIIRENNIMRYSDDGEPSGTSGMPTLDILRKENLTDAIVVTTRYFGGTLLGTGGLVRAYGKAAKAGVEAAGIVTRALCRRVTVSVDYAMSGKIQYAIAEADCSPQPPEYGERVLFPAIVKSDLVDRFVSDMTEASFGQAEITVGEEDYMDL